MKIFEVQTGKHTECVALSSSVRRWIEIKDGLAQIYIPHTTAAVIINEGYDPDVTHDLLKHLDNLVPWEQPYFKHGEGNSAAHIKAALLGNSVTVIVEGGNLKLGAWEEIFLVEFDGPRTRKVYVKEIPN
ncbi:MAG: YjbQ family protein [Candidatus Heimdallarchaeota archaeon]|nr:YjbQ family protein [Candidatus Heimdallarchaeota archaeon]